MDPVSNLTNDLSKVNVSSGQNNQEAVGGNKSSGGTSSTFRWKVDAPEFVPRSMMTAGGAAVTAQAVSASSSGSSAQQTGAAPSSISYAAVTRGAAAAASSNAATSDDQPTGQVNADVEGGDLYPPLSEAASNYVNWVLTDLQNSPESYETLFDALLLYVNENIFTDELFINSVLSQILEASLTVDNFAFLCVRLVVFLHDNYMSPVANASWSSSPFRSKGLSIRDDILTCLEKEFSNRKKDLKTAEQNPRLFMFVNVLCMFSTSLLVKGQALKPLIAAIYDVLDLIMDQRTEENVRFSIQTLKAVGAHLECAEKAETAEGTGTSGTGGGGGGTGTAAATAAADGTTPRMDALIDHLERIGTEPDSKLSDNTKFMIRNLRGVRRHWAYSAPPNPNSQQQKQVEVGARRIF